MPLVEVVRPQLSDRAVRGTARRQEYRARQDAGGRARQSWLHCQPRAEPYLNEAVLLVAEGSKSPRSTASCGDSGCRWNRSNCSINRPRRGGAGHVGACSRRWRSGSSQNDVFERMLAATAGAARKAGVASIRYSRKSATAKCACREPAAAEEPLCPHTGVVIGGTTAEDAERMVLLMVNEAAMVLSEEVAENAETIDLALVLGTGRAAPRRTVALCG